MSSSMQNMRRDNLQWVRNVWKPIGLLSQQSPPWDDRDRETLTLFNFRKITVKYTTLEKVISDAHLSAHPPSVPSLSRNLNLRLYPQAILDPFLGSCWNCQKRNCRLKTCPHSRNAEVIRKNKNLARDWLKKNARKGVHVAEAVEFLFNNIQEPTDTNSQNVHISSTDSQRSHDAGLYTTLV